MERSRLVSAHRGRPHEMRRSYAPWMRASEPPVPPDGLTRAKWRSIRRRTIEMRRRLDDRNAFLESSLEPRERVVAQSGTHPIVTDRRILDATQLRLPPRKGEWVAASLPFADITGWSLGRQHDERPLLVLEHVRHPRIEHAPAHRLLWFRWGDAEVPVTHTTTRLAFGRDSNPVLVAILAELARRELAQGPSFVIRPVGSRAERLRGTRGPLAAGYRRAPSLWRVAHVVYRGRLALPVRLMRWLLVGVPAWLIERWLVLPAILLSELVWIIVMQLIWRRDRVRRSYHDL
jgi:hypothetical protein